MWLVCVRSTGPSDTAGRAPVAPFLHLVTAASNHAAQPQRFPDTASATVVKTPAGPLPIDIGELERTYAVVREIGRGGMGAVVLARHREARHYVAIKIASTDRLDAESLARFSREAYLMARFRHPNIVSLYTVEPIGQGRVGIVMEYVRGQSLARLLSSGKRLPLETCTRIVRDLGKALAHAHAHGVVHRDVKPQNVLVEDESGTAKLADFGIAKVTSDAADVTATGAALGTPAYMSPEQIDGAALDGRSDIYSLGVLAWEMVTGQRPWAGEPLFRLLYKQKHEALPAVTIFRPDTGIGLQLAIEGALAKDPAARWWNVADMLAQLDENHPTTALLERREREAELLRARSAGAPSDASTIPVKRATPEASRTIPSPESPIGEEPSGESERRWTPVGQATATPQAPWRVPSVEQSWWRRYLPFVGGLMLGGGGGARPVLLAFEAVPRAGHCRRHARDGGITPGGGTARRITDRGITRRGAARRGSSGGVGNHCGGGAPSGGTFGTGVWGGGGIGACPGRGAGTSGGGRLSPCRASCRVDRCSPRRLAVSEWWSGADARSARGRLRACQPGQGPRVRGGTVPR